MGGRGSSSGARGSNKSNGKTFANLNTKFTTKQISSMSRSQLETAAKAVFVKMGMKQGLSASEALYRASSLMGGNSDAQLRKYIKKNG